MRCSHGSLRISGRTTILSRRAAPSAMALHLARHPPPRHLVVLPSGSPQLQASPRPRLPCWPLSRLLRLPQQLLSGPAALGCLMTTHVLPGVTLAEDFEISCLSHVQRSAAGCASLHGQFEGQAAFSRSMTHLHAARWILLLAARWELHYVPLSLRRPPDKLLKQKRSNSQGRSI